ncbi:hypothetical protein TNIN_126811 [Trichonephila inaurata madagascariensis]|uniref:Uncharacterized protein n=1 Tax=Trichonephila inaurata madagascariensis TaxID=2747483 RepID=A0A8X6YE43_9ARAC|nr:hypothetical protein TNIN_126811 [Trichonephila inaurata madagascariensis]
MHSGRVASRFPRRFPLKVCEGEISCDWAWLRPKNKRGSDPVLFDHSDKKMNNASWAIWEEEGMPKDLLFSSNCHFGCGLLSRETINDGHLYFRIAFRIRTRYISSPVVPFKTSPQRREVEFYVTDPQDETIAGVERFAAQKEYSPVTTSLCHRHINQLEKAILQAY